MLANAVCIALLLIAARPVHAWSGPSQEQADADSPAGDPANEQAEVAGPPPRVNWKGLFGQSGMFLAVQHAFRLGTEPGTREGLKGKFWPEYGQAVGNMHGWSDGDPFLVNYVGHPMQGAVSGFIWMQNDRRFYPVRFGRDRAYWESRMRAAAFAYIYSTQFELGPLSEASIGKIQKFYPQQGFVDHVITPTIGVAWMLGEDAIDQYIVVPLEKRLENVVARALLRGGLNPARTFANLMRLKTPWYRDGRPSVGDPRVATFQPRKVHREIPPDYPGVAPVDFEMTLHTQYFPGSGGAWCFGGGGTGSFRLTPSTQAVLELSGCNLMSLGEHQSGDFLTFLAGAKWTGSGSSRWKPHTQLLMGVAKATIETEDPVLKAAAQARPPKPASNLPAYPDYLTLKEDSGFSLAAGAGVDYRLNRALQFRVARIGYRYSALNPLSGYDLTHSLEFTAGLTLRMGSW